ncbi:acetate--CoA ligase family protein [Actinomycetospora straminea]|uniref:Acetate--CoA ligase family protein n=1 Tax=Actinomycetospora straminea TaxID=663607 RepID=A0ABP9E7A5_9PSEU|nr:acetate--CoA ligase family protein [Actinomycetospora straminea]MDD7935337.1 acetate--CoA ligase family protein [Actinomycetospora straminea]
MGPVDAAATDWHRVLAPRSVALVGATGRADNPMARPLRWLTERGFAGRVHPVNPKYDELGGVPCAPSLADVPGGVDLVLALVPAERAAATVTEAGAAGAAAVIVFASGFAEVGDEGRARQEELVAAARAAGTRVLGPNCQGLYDARSRLFATFTGAGERPLTGSSGIAYVGQSGAIGGAVLDVAAERGLDLSAWVSTGNEADVTLTEVGRHLVADPDVSVLAVYAESLPDPGDYAALAAEAAAEGTALVVLRSGRSAPGRRAAVSHTGAMLGDDTAFTLVSRRFGVVLVDDVEELLAAATMLRGRHGRRRPTGRSVGLVTSSGGAGILAADRASEAGLAVPELDERTQAKLGRLVPAFGAVANPVDVTAQLFNDGGSFGEVCGIVRADPHVDAVLVLLTMLVGEAADALARDLAATVAEQGPDAPPVAVVWMAGEDGTAPARAVLRAAGVPVFSSIALAVRVLDAVAAGPGAAPAPLDALDPVPGDGWDLLDALGVRRPRSAISTDPAHTAAAVAELGGRAVLKTEGLPHKTEAGAVRLDVPTDAAASVHAELAALPGATGVLVQERVPDGVELLVSVDGGRDGWPPVLTVGHGGTATEVHRDVVHALAPVTPATARSMLASLRCWPLLAGHRGAPGADLDAAVDAIVRLSRAAGLPGLAELEVNPLVLPPARSTSLASTLALDARIATRSDPRHAGQAVAVDVLRTET